MRGTLFPLVLVPALANPTRADLLTGKVVDGSGAGVSGANLDAYELASGKEVLVTNDGTDGGGAFQATLPAGVYRLVVRAPAGTRLVDLTLPSVVVAGTKPLGTLTLIDGVRLSGRVVDEKARPVGGLDLDVVERATGAELALGGDRTNAFGTFSLVVPRVPLDLELRTEGLDPLLAPRSLALHPLTDLDLGELVLRAGFLLEGRVERASGQALAGVDLDVRESSSGARLFTPRDDTNTRGEFQLVVPAGSYTLELEPRLADQVVAAELQGLQIASDTDLGSLQLAPGVVLSGTVRSAQGQAVAGVDVDVRESVTRRAVPLADDNTDAQGAYAVVVPSGTFDLTFTPPPGPCAVPRVQLAFRISAATVLDASLPDAVTATAASFSGDGVNLDTVTPVPVVLGQSWSAPLQLGNFHGTGGTAVLKLRTGVFNGPTLTSPTGGRAVEVLITGPLLATIPGTHNGTSGGIAPLVVPAQASFLGLPWAAQYTVSGGGFVDLSRAVFGIVGCQ